MNDDRMNIRELGVVALWLGILTGFGELGLWAARRYVFGGIVNFGPDLLWMAPLADAVLFVLLALAAFGLLRLLKKEAGGERIVPVLLFAGTASWALMYPKAHPVALLLLAAGLASVAWRFLGARLDVFRRLVRRTAVPAVAVVLLVALGVRGGGAAAERVGLERLPAAPEGAPNIVLIILDTVRAASLSLYGHDRETTPELERWAQRGAVFDRAFVTAPWTLASHGSMFTGRLSGETGISWMTPMNEAHPTLAEELGEHGYATAGFVANLFYGGRQWGLSRGFLHYDDFPVSPAQVALSSSLVRTVVTNRWLRETVGYHEVLSRKSAPEISEAFLEWSEDRERPYFAFLNYYDAHEPYLPPAPYDTLFGPRHLWNLYDHYPERADRREMEQMTPEHLQGERDAYEGAIAYLDREIGRLLDTLEQRGDLANTMVIITSDHGEEFGGHQANGEIAVGHGRTLYAQAVQVPLVIIYPPRVPAGRRVAWRASLQNLAATTLDLAELPDDELPGQSFAGDFRARPAGLSPAFVEIQASRRSMKSIVQDGFHYIWSPRGEELYDLSADPLERRNLAATDTVTLARLRQAFGAAREPLGRPTAPSGPTALGE